MDEAVDLAQRRYNARVVRAEVSERDGRRVYLLRLLSDDGRVFNVRVDAGHREHPMRLLVVEDEAALREQLRERLAAAGFNVDVAADGEEGLYQGREYPDRPRRHRPRPAEAAGARADPPAARRGPSVPDPGADRARPLAGQGRGPGGGRRRLRRQAVRVRGSAGAHPRAAAARRRLGLGAAALRAGRARHARAARHASAARRSS